MLSRFYECLPQVLGVLSDQKDRRAGTDPGMPSRPLKVSTPRDVSPERHPPMALQEGEGPDQEVQQSEKRARTEHQEGVEVAETSRRNGSINGCKSRQRNGG